MSKTQLLSSTAEVLLEQLMDSIAFSGPDIDMHELQQLISTILNQYDIKPTLVASGHPDLWQKIKLFLAGKRLEGLARSTLRGYELELRIFSMYVPKATSEITTADIRIYLSEFGHLKTSSLSKRLSVLKSMFGWLANEEVIASTAT